MEFTDEINAILFLVGNEIDPTNGVTYIFRDVNGFRWRIPYSKIGTDKGYDWLTKCYPRILTGFAERGHGDGEYTD